MIRNPHITPPQRPLTRAQAMVMAVEALKRAQQSVRSERGRTRSKMRIAAPPRVRTLPHTADRRRPHLAMPVMPELVMILVIVLACLAGLLRATITG
ncbi:hypothetical protein [Novosphingobium sp.]|uniref:hypothetical protein n=1 Tax=Novosphingobium sp. TaxID=1874826 RepID=UPI00333FA92D